MLVNLNGSIIPESEAFVSVKDRGWLYGDGVFETLRTYGGRVFRLEEHLARLERSALLVGIEIGIAPERLTATVNDLLAAEDPKNDVMIRITVTRGEGGALWPVEPLKPTVLVQLRALPHYPDEVFTKGWTMITAKTKRNSPDSINPEIKSTNFLNNILAKKEAAEAGVNEALMLNHEGYAAESSVSNFFMVTGRTVTTPPVEAGILPGITRELVLGLCGQGNFDVEERLFRPLEIYDADEAFLTLTSAGLIPIVALDGREIGGGRPGPAVRELRGLYEKYVAAFAAGGR